MAFKTPDRVRETSTTTGTGDITLAGAVTGWRAFSAELVAGDTFPYVLEGRNGDDVQTAEWETGIGTYSAGGALQRTTVLASSNGGTTVNFASASLVCFIGLNKQGLTDVADARATIQAASAIATHAAEADPHTSYLKESEVTATPTAGLVPRAGSTPQLARRWAPRMGARMPAWRYGLPAQVTNLHFASNTIAIGAAGRLCLAPFIADCDATLDSIAFFNSTSSATANARAVIYSGSEDAAITDDFNVSGANDRLIVGSLLVDTGLISLAAVTQKITAISQAIQKGNLYWIGLWCDENITFYAMDARPLAFPSYRNDNLSLMPSRWYSDAYPGGPPASINAKLAHTTDGTSNFIIRALACLQWQEG
jgi:hypothetical protein